MQFQISGAAPDASVIAAALRLLDPDVGVTVDSQHGNVEVRSSASSKDVVDALRRLGVSATPLEREVHISGGSTCCGGCS